MLATDPLVAPVGSHTTLGYDIHTLGTYLHLYPAVLRPEDRRVEALIAVALRDRDPVLESLGVRAIHIGDDGVDLPADLSLSL